MTDHKSARSGTRILRRVAWIIGGIVVGFFLLLSSLRDVWILELPFHLILGWVLHAAQAAHFFAADPVRVISVAALPCAALVTGLWGAHRLVVWWRRENGNRNRWQFKHTALSGSLLLLGSAAAIALSGVFHELVWLPQGTIIRSNIRSEFTMAMNDARHLGNFLMEHESEDGTVPRSLMDLEMFASSPQSLRRLVFVDLDKHGPPEPFILLKPGQIADGNPSELVMIGPKMAENGDYVALRLDMSAKRQPSSTFIETVKSATNVYDK